MLFFLGITVCQSERTQPWPDRGENRGKRGVSHEPRPLERMVVPRAAALGWERLFLPETLPAPERNFRKEFRGGVGGRAGP